MLPLTPSATTAPHWTPTLRKWLMSLDIVNAVILVLTFVFCLSNAIQVSDNYRAWLSSWESYENNARSSVFCLALFPPFVALVWMYFQRLLYSRKTLAPWVVLTSSLFLIGAWTVVAFWTIEQGERGNGFYAQYSYSAFRSDNPYNGEILYKRDAAPQATVTDSAPAGTISSVQSTSIATRFANSFVTMTTTVTPTRTVVSLAGSTSTFVSAIPQGQILETKPYYLANERGVDISYPVFLTRWILTMLAGVVQLFYMSVAARAIDNRKKAERAAGPTKANVTYYEPSQVGDTLPRVEVPAEQRPRSEAPGYEMGTMPPWSPPRSARGSVGSFESDEKKEAVIKESLRMSK